MNDQLLTSEENEFDPLLLMDDLIVEILSSIVSKEQLRALANNLIKDTTEEI